MRYSMERLAANGRREPGTFNKAFGRYESQRAAIRYLPGYLMTTNFQPGTYIIYTYIIYPWPESYYGPDHPVVATFTKRTDGSVVRTFTKEVAS